MASPKGTYSLGKIYYRADRIKKRKTNLKWTIIRKYMGWCNDPKDKSYNKQIDLRSKKRGEKLFRKDHKYDIFVTINYNTRPTLSNMGSAIFLHLTRNYKSTAGCIAIKQNDFFKLIEIINNKTKIKI